MCVEATSELTSDDPESELFIKSGYLSLIVVVPKLVQITDNWEEANIIIIGPSASVCTSEMCDLKNPDLHVFLFVCLLHMDRLINRIK